MQASTTDSSLDVDAAVGSALALPGRLLQAVQLLQQVLAVLESLATAGSCEAALRVLRRAHQGLHEAYKPCPSSLPDSTLWCGLQVRPALWWSCRPACWATNAGQQILPQQQNILPKQELKELLETGLAYCWKTARSHPRAYASKQFKCMRRSKHTADSSTSQ